MKEQEFTESIVVGAGFVSETAGGPYVVGEVASATNPTLVPSDIDLTTGIGGLGNATPANSYFCGIINGVEVWRTSATIFYTTASVGIGTALPIFKIQVHSVTAAGQMYVSSVAPVVALGNHAVFASATNTAELGLATDTSNFITGSSAGDACLRTQGWNGGAAGSLIFGIGTYECFRIQKTTYNIGLGTSTFGDTGSKVLSWGTGTPPTTSPVDVFQIYGFDTSEGNCSPHFRTELGHVIKLYQQANIGNPSAGATVDAEARTAINAILDLLGNTGLMVAAAHTASHTPSHTPSHTQSPSYTPSHTPSQTPSHTQSPSHTESHTPSHTQSPSHTPSHTPT